MLWTISTNHNVPLNVKLHPHLVMYLNIKPFLRIFICFEAKARILEEQLILLNSNRNCYGLFESLTEYWGLENL